MLQVCSKILKLPVESVGMDDSFFYLGGDSIIAIQFVSQARKQGATLQVLDIFRSPKLVDLAAIANSNIAIIFLAPSAHPFCPCYIASHLKMGFFGASFAEAMYS